MYELDKNDYINNLISITKSNSGVSGPKLAKAHMELGELLAQKLPVLDPEDTTVVALLRGGIFMAEGIYFALGCKFQTFDPKHDVFVRPETKNVIIVDSVINSGKTIKNIITDDMIIACCVINRTAVEMFDQRLYTVRVSDNSFIGSDIRAQHGNQGPDTTMRLFNLL